jgi:2-(1,2-epoxy-1,2-dihydrophenyl)acetyl-CoA isomerase
MDTELVLHQVDGPVHTLVLNRPEKLNAFVADMRDLLLAGVEKAEADDSCRVVVLTCAGRAFSAGGDIPTMAGFVASQEFDEMERLLHAGGMLVRAIRHSRLPFIAAINGPAAGAGLNLALACDIRLAAESATFSESFINIGLHPDWGGTWSLPRLVGPGRAMRMMMTGDPVSAKDGYDMGLVEEVVATDKLADAAHRLAHKIAAGSPRIIASIKKAVYRGHDVDLDSSLAFEAQAQMTAFRTNDVNEGFKAFTEKRKPVFSGT